MIKYSFYIASDEQKEELQQFISTLEYSYDVYIKPILKGEELEEELRRRRANPDIDYIDI